MEYFERLWSEMPEVSSELEELRRTFLISQLHPGVRVLDVGCGEGWFTAALAERGFEVVGVDVAAEAVRRARARYPGLAFSVCGEDSLPFGDGSFDVAWLGEVLEHVRDGLGLLGEVARVIGPGGLLVGSTPDHGRRTRLRLGLSRRAFESHFEPRADHLRFFTRNTLRALLAAEGYGDDCSLASRQGTIVFSARAAR
jgi:2-polyprenyl-3-methyl-5-hydroxy-6-metoxy-1,4-benzoquinol methylase